MIFDSDVVIWASRGDSEAAVWIDAASEPGMSIVTLMEVLQGTRSTAEMRQTRQLIRALQFRVLPLTEAIGDAAVALIEEHALANGLQLADALIAATALDAGEVLATGNARHFRAIRRLEVKAFRPRRR
jgi:predicted nucleic acid-binding protein